MEKVLSTKEYCRNLIFPVLWLVAMTALEAVGIVPPRWGDVFFLLYFGGFFVYFVVVKRQFSIKMFLADMKTMSFWKWVAVCIGLLAAAYGIGLLPSLFFPEKNIVFIPTSFVRAQDTYAKIAFFFAAIVFPGLGQELFYRKAIIRFTSQRAMLLSTLIGALLFAVNDNLDLYGMFRSFLVGLAFAFPYLKTRNIHPSIFAHYFVSVTMSILF